MYNKKDLIKKLDLLEESASEIEELVIKLIQELPILKNSDGSYSWDWKPHKLIKEISNVSAKYIGWYNIANHLVKSYLPKRHEEFVKKYTEYHTGIKELLKFKYNLHIIREDKLGIQDDFLEDFSSQRSILNAIKFIKQFEIDYSKIVNKMSEGEDLSLENLGLTEIEDILDKFHVVATCFKWIFYTENLMRIFIQKTLENKGFNIIEELNDSSLNRKIKDRKREESNHRYLRIRGEHDIFYLDLIDLNIFFHKYWNYFKESFPSQNWITQRIKDIYEIRKRVAHNSSNLTADELKSLKTYCREILKQISSQ